MSTIEDNSVHLVCTSPPYAFLKEYRQGVDGQLGDLLDYDHFLEELDKVWRECERVLVPGGRVACVVGDVCLSRKRAKRHHVLPLGADIQVRVRRLGLDNLTPIRWHKVANIKLEASKSSVFLGKPNQPGGVVKNDVEHILLFRKPGGYRKPTPEMMEASRIDTDDYVKWFTPIWSGVTGQHRKGHPAPYPVEIPRRLVRMYSFAGDTVLDPFGGTGTTSIAAMESGRNSIMYEIDESYIEMARERFEKEKIPVTYSEALTEATTGEDDRLVRARAVLAEAMNSTDDDFRAAIEVAQRLLRGDDQVTLRRLSAG